MTSLFIAAFVSYFSLLHRDTIGTSTDHFSCLRFTIKLSVWHMLLYKNKVKKHQSFR